MHVAAETFVSARTMLPTDVSIQDAALYFKRFNTHVSASRSKLSICC